MSQNFPSQIYMHGQTMLQKYSPEHIGSTKLYGPLWPLHRADESQLARNSCPRLAIYKATVQCDSRFGLNHVAVV